MVFLRDHLSPRYSEIAKPLRDVLKQLQADRKAGKKRGKAKYRPLGRAAPDGNWAPFWTNECEEAFLALKRLAIAAIEIQVPDYEGAMDGTNPLHLWPDACGFGIGAGLFQGSPKKSTDPSTYYDVLGVPSWCTKTIIERRYHELIRLGKRHDRSAEEKQAIETAFETLRDTEKRKQYDDTLGMASSRRSRLTLRPLGMFSKSLTKAQQNWTTWERELLVVVEALEHFRSVVAGMSVFIHTDHLNNTSHTTALSYPDKILRMLLKV